MLIFTAHAHERLCQRFGWPGSADEAAAALAKLEPVRRALAASPPRGGVEWHIALPDLGMGLVLIGAHVITVLANTRKGQRAKTRHGVRGGKQGRTEPRRQGQPEWEGDD